MLPVAAVQSSFNIAIRYVLPVLWMSSCFDIMSASEWKPNVIPRHAHSLLLAEWFTKLLSLARWQHHVVATGARSAVVSCRVEFTVFSYIHVIFSCLLLNGDLSKIFLRFFFCFLTGLNTCTDYWHQTSSLKGATSFISGVRWCVTLCGLWGELHSWFVSRFRQYIHCTFVCLFTWLPHFFSFFFTYSSLLVYFLIFFFGNRPAPFPDLMS